MSADKFSTANNHARKETLMGTLENEISLLTNEELAERLRSIGETFGPITPTTRSQYERKLKKRLVLQNAASCTISYNLSPNNSSAVEADSHQSLTEVKEETNESSDSCGHFYGVQLPPNVPQAGKCVFTKVEDALKLSREIPGSRFNKFSSRSEAEAFCCLTNEPNRIIAKSELVRPVPSESSPFKAPRLQDLTILRKAIEGGDLNAVRSLIWSNPRYLIGSGDNPTILQEGFRYNALHVCARTNQAEAAKLILDTIECLDFMKLMYPDESEESGWNRINNLSDMYINTPDKGINDTPLHFACKFGSLSVVSLLVRHPKINLQVTNVHNETPRDVVCSRMNNPSSEVKNKFYRILESQYYVPLLRSDDNSCPAKVAQPICLRELSLSKWNGILHPNASDGRPSADPGCTVGSPKDSPLSVRACAGPMSRSEAVKLHKKWMMSPGGLKPKDFTRYTHIRRSDTNKGLERIGRDLAKEMNVSWLEYWDFLNTSIDLTTDEGLQKLENHLMLSKEATMLEISQRKKVELEMKKDVEICDMLDQLHLFDKSNDFSKSLGQDFSNKGGQLLAIGSQRSAMDELSGSRSASVEALSEKQTRVLSAGDTDCDRDSECSFHTAADDLDLEYSDCSELFDETITETVVRLFMMGEEPCKTDADVLRAVENTCIEPGRYPLLHQWKRDVTSFPEDARSRWVHYGQKNQLQNRSSIRKEQLCSPDGDRNEGSFNCSPLDQSPPSPRLCSTPKGHSVRINLFSRGSFA